MGGGGEQGAGDARKARTGAAVSTAAKGGAGTARMAGPRQAAGGAGAVDARMKAGPVFLERASYRQRRMGDAVRLLPVLGALLWLVPLLWGRGETGSSVALLYVFGIWAGLVVAAALLSHAIRGTPWGEAGGESEDGPAAPAARGEGPG